MSRRDKAIFLGLFFISGACGLVYEIVWSRLLVFVFGGTTFAVTTVLTCFMGGLALGSFLAGRWGQNLRRPRRIYGLLEIAIGLYALAVPALMDASTGFYRWLVGGSTEDQFLLLTVARILVSGILLLVPTTAMGATLPLLARAFAAKSHDVASEVGSLYGANTAGAFAGCAGAGFILLPQLGLTSSIFLAAAANVTAGAIAVLLPGAAGEPGKAGEEGHREARTSLPEPHVGRGVLLVLYALSGFAAMAYQVAWTRALVLSMGASTYSFSVIVSSFILGLAAGSLAMAVKAEKVEQPLFAAGVLEAAIGVAALVVAPFFGELPAVVSRLTLAEGATFDGVLLVEAAMVFGLLAVPTFCMGALLPLVCRIYDPRPRNAGRSVGNVYAANTVGTIAGAAVAGFVLIPSPWVGMQKTIWLASGLSLAIGTVFILRSGAPRRRRRALLAASWLAALAIVAVVDPWSRASMVSGPYLGRGIDPDWEVVFYREGIDATVAVERSSDGVLSLRVNGKPEASTDTDMPTQVLLGAIPLLMRPEARDVAVIGLGSGVTAGAALAFPVARLDVAEISAAVVEAAAYFAEAGAHPLRDPRLVMHRADGRNFFLLNDRKYDVVISEPSNPWIAGVANLFTREFFELSRSRLEPGGIHAQWIQGYTIRPDDFGAVLNTLAEVYPHTQVWELGYDDYLLLGSDEPLELDLESLYFSFGRDAVRRFLAKTAITHPPQLAHHYVGEVRDMAAWIGEQRILVDDLPHLEYSAPRSLLTHAHHEISRTLHRFASLPSYAEEPDDPLRRRFAETLQRARSGLLSYREAARAGRAGDLEGHVAGLRGAVKAALSDRRTLDAITESLDNPQLPRVHLGLATLKRELEAIRRDAWPFTRKLTDDERAAIAEALRQAADDPSDGELRAPLLRAWMMEPGNAAVTYALARLYAERGEAERARDLLEATLENGAAGRYRDDPWPASLGGDPELRELLDRLAASG